MEQQNNIAVQWEDIPDILTVKEMASFLKIGITKSYELCRIEGFPSINFGKKIRIPKEALQTWINNQAFND
jgi:excisionase family DNA binding protein